MKYLFSALSYKYHYVLSSIENCIFPSTSKCAVLACQLLCDVTVTGRLVVVPTSPQGLSSTKSYWIR